MSFAVVVSDIAPLYTKPEPLCELADEALYGMVLEVLAREGMYCRVRTHYRYEGWTPCAPAFWRTARCRTMAVGAKAGSAKTLYRCAERAEGTGRLPAEHAEGSFSLPGGRPG